MRKSAGFGLVELLVAVAAAAVLLVAAVVTLTRSRQVLTTETEATASMEEAAQVLEAVEKSVGDAPVAAILPGASSTGLGVLTAEGAGYSVLGEGYTPTSFRVVSASGQPFQVGDAVLLANGAGQFFYLPGVEGVTQVDPTAGIWEVRFSSCANPVRWTPATRAYRARLTTLNKVAQGLEITTGGTRTVVPASDVQFRYVYASNDGTETIRTDYAGGGAAAGRLSGVAVYALGRRGNTERNLTLRLPLATDLRDVQVCGGNTPPGAGTGSLTVLVLPPPPGGGSVTLSSGSYLQSFATTSRFDDVPVGTFTVQAREVWSDALTLWRVAGSANWTFTGTLHAFAPQTVTVRYEKVPGTLAIDVSGVPNDAPVDVDVRGPESKTVSRTGPGRAEAEVLPGRYTLQPLRSTVERTDGTFTWTEDFDPTATGQQAIVTSLQTTTTKVNYRGPVQGTLCLDSDCRQADPGVYDAPPDTVSGPYWKSTTLVVNQETPCPNATYQNDPYAYSSRTYETTETRTKTWTPPRGALSSRSRLTFSSSVEIDTNTDSSGQDGVNVWPDCSTYNPDTFVTYYYLERSRTSPGECSSGQTYDLLIRYASGREERDNGCY